MIDLRLGELTAESVEPFVGTEFHLDLADGRSTTVTLNEAAKLNVRQPRRRTPLKREPFSLYFTGDPGIVLPQGMYNLRSESARLEGVFLVPIGRDETATEYEAVFA